MAVLEQRVNPIPVVRRWAHELTACRPTACLQIRVAERACSLWVVLSAARGLLVPEDLLMGAFRLFVATGAAKPRVSMFITPHGLGVSVAALLEALWWTYPGETSACRCWRLHWSEGVDVYLLRSLLTPPWNGGPVPAHQGRTDMPGWDQEPHRRLVLVEEYVAGIVSAKSVHMLGLPSRGFIFCSRYGDSRAGRGLREAVELVLGRVGRVWQVWYVLLPRGDVIGTRPRVIGAGGFPSWHWRVCAQTA